MIFDVADWAKKPAGNLRNVYNPVVSGNRPYVILRDGTVFGEEIYSRVSRATIRTTSARFTNSPGVTTPTAP